MKCRKCGAELLDTDAFCVKCGQRVDQPMFCSNCGEELRDGERYCHKCGFPVEGEAEDDEIPLSRLNTTDIPFEQIEQGLLLEAKQAIVKRPEEQRPAEKGSEEGGSLEAREGVREDAAKLRIHTAPRPQREEKNDEEVYEEEDDEESGDSKMKLITAILAIAVVAVALAIGFVIWQRNFVPGSENSGQEVQAGDGENGTSADIKGRIQVLTNDVNIRNKPTTEGSEVIGKAKTGEFYEYYEAVDDAWYHIRLDSGSDGYISAKYVEEE